MNLKRQTASLILVALYLSYFSFTHFFVHSHLMPKGIIVHSHPYSTSKSHTHTSVEIQLIDELGNYICLSDAEIPHIDKTHVQDVDYYVFVVSATPQSNTVRHALRGPPVQEA